MTLLPFSTRLLADFLTYRTAFLIYWANVSVSAPRSTQPGPRGAGGPSAPRRHGEISRAVKRRIVVAQALYAVGALPGLVVAPPLGVTLIILIQLNYALAPRLPILSRL